MRDTIGIGRGAKTSGTPRGSRPDQDWLTVESLKFFAGHPSEAARFFTWSGLEAGTIRSAAADPGFPNGVLDYFAQNLRSLESFCDAAGVAPGDVIALHDSLRSRGLTSHDEL